MVEVTAKPRRRQEEEDKVIDRFGITDLGTYSYLEGSQGSIELERISRDLVHSGKMVVVDLETNGKDPLMNRILLVSFTSDGRHAYVFSPLTVDITPFLEVLRRNPISNQFIKFDYEFIKAKYGVEMNIEWDTQVTHSIATAGMAPELGGNGLANLSRRYLKVDLDKVVRKDFLTGIWRLNKYIAYAAADALSTYQLVPITRKLLEASGSWHIWEKIEKPLIKVIADMELRGINVDLGAVLDLRDKYQKMLDEVAAEIETMTTRSTTVDVTCPECNNRGKKKLTCVRCFASGKIPVASKVSVNPGSPKQVIEYFERKKVKVPTKERTTGAKTSSVDEKSLKKIDHPFARLLEKYREYSKALSAFLIPWSTPCDTNPDGKFNPTTGCIHAEITQTDTETGRTSMRDPNLQQVPRESEFRHVFIAPQGHTLIVCDYSQYELRVLAELANDATMRGMFAKRAELVSKMEAELEKIGEVAYTKDIGKDHPELTELHTLIERDNDIHSQTAITIFKLDPKSINYDSDEWKLKRASAKCVSFGIPYGSGARTVAERSNGAMNEEEARKNIETYFETFPGVKTYIDETKRKCSNMFDPTIPANMGLAGNNIVWSESLGLRKRFYIIPGKGKNNDEEVMNRQIRAKIQRQAVNHRIQGTNADATKLAMVMMYEEFNKPQYRGQVHIRLMVHDEIVVSCPKDMAKDVARTQLRLMKEASQVYMKTVPTEVSCIITDKWTK